MMTFVLTVRFRGRNTPQWGWHRSEPTGLSGSSPTPASRPGPGSWTSAQARSAHRATARRRAPTSSPSRPTRVALSELRRRIGDAVTVVQADAADHPLPRRPPHVVASPPYRITTQVLGRLMAPGSRLQTAHFVLQEQAARRWMNGRAPGAARWQRESQVMTGRPVPRHAFVPPRRCPAGSSSFAAETLAEGGPR